MLRKITMLFVATFFAVAANAGEFIVKYKNQQSFDVLFNEIHVTNKGDITEVHYPGKLARVVTDQQSEIELFKELKTNKNVEYVVKNFQFKTFKPITTPLAELREQYANVITKAEEAWVAAGNKGSKTVRVAVIDTGADYNHESLKANMLPGYDFAENDDDPMDKTSFQNPGHGTHVSGSVGSTGTVENGTQGASPMVSIIPVRFLDERGSGDLMNSVKAIDFAIEQGAHVMNASWGAEVPLEQAQPITDAIIRAQEAGIAFVAAAGNSSKDNDVASFFPTNAPVSNVISVAATDASDKKASFSNFGEHSVDIAAPGVDIMSTIPGNKYQNLSGTSMASPFVAGAIAFLKAQDMSYTPEELEALIQFTGDKAEVENACNCRINVLSAYNALSSKQAFFVPTTTTVAPGSTQNFYVRNFETVEYTTSDASVATIDEKGMLTAVGDGTVTLTAKNANGDTVSSLNIRIAKKSDGGSGGGGGGGGQCPFPDPAMCEILCQIMPEMCP